MQDFKHLSYASSLCGKCSEVCPVKIDIHSMLLLNRRDAVNQKLATSSEKLGWYFWKKSMLKRSKMDLVGGKLKNFVMNTFFGKMWGKNRTLPKVEQQSFSKQWKDRNKQ
jgi:L-lactate dehydrogenase complex protein LldF